MMKMEDYKKLITQMVQNLEESDYLFLKQIYTIVKKHLDKRGRH